MALTVRPDDEVYQFDTVWLGPDEYTLPIQARYVAWGTWLACFLIAAVVLIPLGGDGPAGVLGSLIWSLALSVVLSRAVMLVVDHERPLRSLPALFSAEARAALQARRRGDRSLLVRPGRIRVRDTPPKVVAMRERQRSRVAARTLRKHPAAPADLEPVPVPDEPAWTPDDWTEPAEPVPTWSVPVHADSEPYAPAPVPVLHPAAPPAPAAQKAAKTAKTATDKAQKAADRTARKPAQSAPSGRHAASDPTPAPVPVPAVPAVAATVAARPSPFRDDPHTAEPYRGPVTVAPDSGRHATPPAKDTPDRQAAIEARILLPARKDR